MHTQAFERSRSSNTRFESSPCFNPPSHERISQCGLAESRVIFALWHALCVTFPIIARLTSYSSKQRASSFTEQANTEGSCDDHHSCTRFDSIAMNIISNVWRIFCTFAVRIVTQHKRHSVLLGGILLTLSTITTCVYSHYPRNRVTDLLQF